VILAGLGQSRAPLSRARRRVKGRDFSPRCRKVLSEPPFNTRPTLASVSLAGDDLPEGFSMACNYIHKATSAQARKVRGRTVC